MNTRLVIIILVVLITIILIYQLFILTPPHFQTTYNCPPCNIMKQEERQPSQIITQESPISPQLPLPPLPPSPVLPPVDIVRKYDYNKLYDPLTEATRRIPRYDIPPIQLKRIIDIPTRGYPDNYTQFGVLVKKDDPNRNNDNKIIRLFGRQEYPGSNRYEYYTLISSGNDQIKIPLDVRRRELQDGDKVYVRELNEKYIVQLYKFDAPRYYPDIIF